MSNTNSPEELSAAQLLSGAAEAAADTARLNAEQARKRQALQLMRARICDQLTRATNSRYVDMLNAELQQIDGDLSKLL
jgi:hypothetical protein